MSPHWGEQYLSIITGGDVSRREWAADHVPLGVLYSWVHAWMHQQGVTCITPAVANLRLGKARAQIAEARLRR